MEGMNQDNLFDAAALLKRAGVQEGMTVADCGVGRTAAVTLAAAQLVGERGVVYACDVVRSVLDVVKAKVELAHAGNVRLVWTDLEVYRAAKQIIDESVDVVVLADTLSQSQRRAAMLHECARMVKPGGTLLVVEWKPDQTVLGPKVEHRLYTEELKPIAELNRLEILEEFEAGEYHWGALLHKR
ncbi:MAG: methyltransferase domain-containing protein [Candidatus Kerfeldbacteria bacterium]|nr:methyltransferase domain-containing protein [Candidatus Kerfeldbacteria bacterium]